MFIRNIKLSPDVYERILDRIAAKLELAKAHIEETGRIRVAQLEADMRLKVASLVADAKGQYPKAIGEALAEIARNSAVFTAYNALYELGHIRPHRTVVFNGFSTGELSAAESAMMVADSATAAIKK